MRGVLWFLWRSYPGSETAEYCAQWWRNTKDPCARLPNLHLFSNRFLNCPPLEKAFLVPWNLSKSWENGHLQVCWTSPLFFFARFPTRFSLEISHRSVAWVCLRIGPTPDCHGWSALSQIKMHFASIILGVLWGILHSGAKPHGHDLACGFHYIVMMILIITIDSRICTLNVSRPQTTSPKIVSMWASQIWLNHIKWSFFGTWGRTKSVK